MQTREQDSFKVFGGLTLSPFGEASLAFDAIAT
jgi:hypothetical protein